MNGEMKNTAAGDEIEGRYTEVNDEGASPRTVHGRYTAEDGDVMAQSDVEGGYTHIETGSPEADSTTREADSPRGHYTDSQEV